VAEAVHTTAGTEVPAEHQEAAVLGFMTPGFFVALAMLLVFAIMLWQKVPAMIARALDSKIAALRAQLEEAKSLREEAEALRREYEKKAKSADKEAAAMIERAKGEAEAIVKRADADAKALIERRTRMAEDKIAAEERAAIHALRSSAAAAAATAAEKLIGKHHDGAADARLVDEAISGLGKGA
jgi:F-type H+-transporting ATPase subunit b